MEIIATTTISRVADVNSIELVGDGFSASLASLDSSGVATFNLSSNPFVIPAWGEKTLSLKANVGGYGVAVSGDTVKFAIATTTYQGAVSGTDTNLVTDTEANTMTVYRTRPTVAFVGPTASLTDGTHTLLEFSITADDAKDVNLYGVNLDVTLTDNATATDLEISDITLYDKSDMSTALNNEVATSTSGGAYGVTTTVANSDFGASDTSLSKSGNILLLKNSGSASSTLDVIPAGQTVTYVVQATVSHSAQYDSIIARLADHSTSMKNAITWGDQTSTNIASTHVKTLPTSYSSLSR